MDPWDSTHARPASRRHELPVVRGRRMELETCAYCPRLCRAVCPVSNAEPREALIPFGKMVSLLSTETSGILEEPWACTGCGACTELCLHDNPVAEVLIEGRAAVFEAGRAPEAAVAVAREHPGRVLRQAAQIAELAELVSTDPAARTAVLLGCPTLGGPAETAAQIVRTAARLAGEPLRLVSECCGLVPALAGDRAGARSAEERLGRALQGAERLIVVDPGCSKALAASPSGRRALGRKLEVMPFFSWAAGHGDELRRVARPGVRYGWQLPCWARGTAAEPGARVLLERLLGEFTELEAGCTGGGGLVPSVFPDASRRIGEARLGEFRAVEVDAVVVGCASGARRLRSSGEGSPEVIELVSLVWEALAEQGGTTMQGPAEQDPAEQDPAEQDPAGEGRTAP